MNVQLINADARSIPLADQSVQCVVTSPPYYGLRDYGIDEQIGLEPTPDEYVANMVTVMREVKRVLKDDGVLWLNIGDSYATQHATGTKDSDTGWKHGELSKGHQAWAGGLGNGVKPKDLIGIPWMLAFALRGDGWYLRQDIFWHKPNPMPESVKDRCTKAHEYVFLLTKSARYYYDAEAVSEPSSSPKETENRYKYQFMTGQKHVSGGYSPNNQKHTAGYKNLQYDGQQPNTMHEKRLEGEEYQSPVRNKRSVWTINTQPTKEAHFATFPEKLVEPCILAGSRVGDVVFDPFMGSGTVARVAIKHNRHAIGTELNLNYIQEIAHKRIAAIQPIMNFKEKQQ